MRDKVTNVSRKERHSAGAKIHAEALLLSYNSLYMNLQYRPSIWSTGVVLRVVARAVNYLLFCLGYHFVYCFVGTSLSTKSIASATIASVGFQEPPFGQSAAPVTNTFSEPLTQ